MKFDSPLSLVIQSQHNQRYCYPYVLSGGLTDRKYEEVLWADPKPHTTANAANSISHPRWKSAWSRIRSGASQTSLIVQTGEELAILMTAIFEEVG